ncbi:MAG TPA: hypothetical protein EYP56_19785 [Planctomycetaceae bacterium]|nr:hypothetical protein [Planctomycetaceae bacterium]
MRSGSTLALSAACLLGLGLTGIGQAAETDTKGEAARPAAPDVAMLRAEIHRTMAALIEAQAAEEPDEAKVKALTEKLQSMREKLRTTIASPLPPGQAGPWPCPFGFPGRRGLGMGLGYRGGWGALDAGRPRGVCPFGYMGRGGQGMGPRGRAAWAPAGPQRGFGPGRGVGMGRGGPGRGRGPAGPRGRW